MASAPPGYQGADVVKDGDEVAGVDHQQLCHFGRTQPPTRCDLLVLYML